jgi:hypothetical protein
MARENQSTQRLTCLNTALAIKNSTWAALTKLGFRGGKTVTNYVRYGRSISQERQYANQSNSQLNAERNKKSAMTRARVHLCIYVIEVTVYEGHALK